MAPKLYKLDVSPPARSAMMACALFDVPVEMVDIDLFQGAHMQPDYMKKNPLHTVPVLEDGDLTLHDSHAILAYLADTYGKNDSLYPKDVKQRALVNQKLFFNSSVLFTKLRNITYGVIVEGVKTITEKQLNEVEQTYGYLEAFLSATKYLAGNNITIADVSAFATVSSMVYLKPLDASKYPKTQAWLKEMEGQAYAKKHNADGAAKLGGLVKKMTS